MPSLWQHISGRLDRSKNPAWGWRMSLIYGMGVWTMLGVLFVRWMSSADDIKAAQLGVTPEALMELSEEEKDSIRKKKKLTVSQRQEELAEYVAENRYTPVDFMG